MDDGLRFDPDYKNAAFALYRYAPSLAGAIVFCIVFFITTSLHTLQMARTKTWYMLPFVIGGFCTLSLPGIHRFTSNTNS